MPFRRLALAVFAVSLAAAGCADPNAKSGAFTSGTGATGAASASCNDALGSGVVVSADGIQITGTEVENATAGQTFQQRREMFETRANWAQNEVAKRLITREATKAGMTMDEFLSKKVDGEGHASSDADAKMFYNANQQMMKKPDGSASSFDEMKDRIKQYLDGQGKQGARQQFIAKLMEENHVKVELEAPEPPVVNVSVDDDPYEGPKDAPITIVEFSDFQCPACRQAFTGLDKLLGKYEGKVKFVYRDFPLLGKHPNAMPAAIAANCALAQGMDKYWAYNHALFTNQQALSETDFKRYAADIKLDAKKFDSCLTDPKMSEEVKKDLADGEAAGINSTPTFFVNGRMIPGSNMQELSRLIEKELKKAGS